MGRLKAVAGYFGWWGNKVYARNTVLNDEVCVVCTSMHGLGQEVAVMEMMVCCLSKHYIAAQRSGEGMSLAMLHALRCRPWRCYKYSPVDFFIAGLALLTTHLWPDENKMGFTE